ncbi:MAG: hypothetical protein V1740_06615, partial [Candidatus Woesearchaeota archaeon]
IGILGPVNIDIFCKVLKLKRLDYLNQINELAGKIAKGKHSIVIVPHKGSIQSIFTQYYKRCKGRKVIGIIPKDDTEWGIDYLDQEICDEIVDAGTWRNSPEKLDEESDILVCLGFGPGTIVEIGHTKWFKVDKIYIIKDFITQKLPDEINGQLPIEYISLEDLKKII